MSGFQHKEGSGSLFRNDRKDKDTQPDWRGDLLLNGVLYEVSGWDKTSKRGPMIGLAGKPKQEVAERGSRAMREEPRRPSFKEEMDDDLPF